MWNIDSLYLYFVYNNYNNDEFVCHSIYVYFKGMQTGGKDHLVCYLLYQGRELLIPINHSTIISISSQCIFISINSAYISDVYNAIINTAIESL